MDAPHAPPPSCIGTLVRPSPTCRPWVTRSRTSPSRCRAPCCCLSCQSSPCPSMMVGADALKTSNQTTAVLHVDNWDRSLGGGVYKALCFSTHQPHTHTHPTPRDLPHHPSASPSSRACPATPAPPPPFHTPALDGRGKEALMLTELYGGARIAYIFNNIFCSKVRVGAPTRSGPRLLSISTPDTSHIARLPAPLALLHLVGCATTHTRAHTDT
jgi:hypothetical protein